MTLEIRPARQEEMTQLGAIASYVYAGNFGEGEDNRVARLNRPEWTLCAFDGPRMVASYSAIPFTIRANGQAMAFAGVTAVGTLPEYRRRGLLRRITTESFAHMRDQGQTVAGLWASQAAIYQRYGYALASVRRRYEIDSTDIQLLREPDPALEVARVPSAEALDDLKNTYRAFVARRSGYLHRSQVLWRETVLSAEQGPRHVALCRDPDGTCLGYLVYTLTSEAREHPTRFQGIVVYDSAWLTLDAYRALWAFLARHDLVGRIRFDWTSVDDPSPELLQEPRLLHSRDADGGWLRMIDVEAALARRGYDEDGSITLKIPADDLAPWNAGTYRLTVEGGEAQVERVASEPDVTMDVKSLASAFTGFRTVRELAHWSLAEGEASALERASRLLETRYRPHWPDMF